MFNQNQGYALLTITIVYIILLAISGIYYLQRHHNQRKRNVAFERLLLIVIISISLFFAYSAHAIVATMVVILTLLGVREAEKLYQKARQAHKYDQLLQSVHGLTLMIGECGTGKTHLALNRTIADLKSGKPVVYICMAHESEWCAAYLRHYISDNKIRILSPNQIDTTALFGDPSLALSFANGTIYPTLESGDIEPVIMPGTITLLNFDHSWIGDDVTRDYLAGRILQHVSLHPQGISLYVDEFHQFIHKINHPIIQHLLADVKQSVTIIIQSWGGNDSVNIPKALSTIPLFLAFRQNLHSASISGQILGDEIGNVELQRMDSGTAYYRRENQTSFIKLGKDKYAI